MRFFCIGSFVIGRKNPSTYSYWRTNSWSFTLVTSLL